MMLRRMKEDVEKSLAPKEETIVEVNTFTCSENFSHWKAPFKISSKPYSSSVTHVKTHNLSTSCACNKLVNKFVAMLLFCQVVPSLWLTTCWQVVRFYVCTTGQHQGTWRKPVVFGRVKLEAGFSYTTEANCKQTTTFYLHKLFSSLPSTSWGSSVTDCPNG